MTGSIASRTNPYPGLVPFDERDSGRFFGRDREIEQVVDRLNSRRLLAVIGVSGCGKSSLVRAGVVPVLRMGLAPSISGKWSVLTITPGNSPLQSLASALAAPAGWPTNSFDLLELIRNRLVSGENMLLIIDQFEELFLFRSETIERDGGNAASLFVNLLLNAVDQREIPVYLLITMRTDFLGECAQFRGLPEALNDCYYLVPRMTRLQQQDAIERPCQEEGVTIHPALTQQLLNDSAEVPDHLPVLQHLLRRLWENWSERSDGDPIGLNDYHAVGGWSEALNFDAERVLQHFEAVEDGIRAVFQWITDSGLSGRAVSRPRPFSECIEISGLDAERLSEVLRRFQDRGLLRNFDLTEDRLVQLPHESVTWQWSRLEQWILEESEQAAQIRFLLHAARQRMPLTGLALKSGLQLRLAWQKTRRQALRYLKPKDIDEVEAWIDRSADLDRTQRSHSEARELSAWAALSLNSDPERSLILGLYSWGKQCAMVTGLEELLHAALLCSPSRLTLRHHGTLWSLAWSPDGAMLATASADGTAVVWDVESGGKLLGLSSHRGVVTAIAWSPDGRKLATAGFDGTARVWDAVRGLELLVLSGNEFAILGIAWSPDGSKLATAGDDNTVKIWQLSDGKETFTLQGHGKAVWAVAWAPDGTRLASASRDRSAVIWDADAGIEILKLANHAADVRSVAWSPDGRKLATASLDGTAKVWDASTGEELCTLRGHGQGVLCIAWSPDGSVLATGGVDAVAKVWDPQNGYEWFTVRGHQYAVLSVAWSPDGRKLATASDDHTARVIEPGTGRELIAIHEDYTPIWSIAWSPDGTKLAIGRDRPTVKVYDAENGREVVALTGGESHVESVAWSPDGQKLATSFDCSVKVWDAGMGSELGVIPGHTKYVGATCWSPDGTRLATGSRDYSVKIWDVESFRELCGIECHEGDIRSVAWSPDGLMLCTASEDQTAKLVKFEPGGTWGITGLCHRQAVTSIAWSPDGSKVATASSDSIARIWDVHSGIELIHLIGHQGAVLTIAWSPDGTRIATGGWDNTVKVWDALTGREVLTLRSHQSSPRVVVWSPNGRRLASGGMDGLIQVYAIDTTLLLRLVRARITKKLSVEECRRFLNAEEAPPLPDVP